MKLYDLSVSFFVGFVVIAIATYALNYYFPSYPDDNIFEEYVEKTIEDALYLPHQTIDLSPDSKEK